MSALDKKLVRDVVRLAGQGVTIALVVAAGIAAFVSLRTTYASLLRSRDVYYDRARMPDLFVDVTRAPLAVAERIAALPGVAAIDTRIEGPVRVMIEGELDPPVGIVQSIDDLGLPRLGTLVLRAGRLPDVTRRDEALLLHSFATRRGVALGERLTVIVDGTARSLRVVGFAMSPELVMPIVEGAMIPDADRVAVFFMRRRALEPLLDMRSSFTKLVVDVAPEGDERAVADAIERLLAPYGARGVVDRAHQPSARTLDGELAQLAGMSTFVPFLFLFVSAFLVHVVLSRLIQLQRGQIAMLRAIGYTRGEIVRHYLALVTIVVLLGAVLGVGLGVYLGEGMTGLYDAYFHFPERVYHVDAPTVIAALLASATAAFVGAFATAWSVTGVAPAAAMQPPTPAIVRPGLLDRAGVSRLLGPILALVTREIRRRPVRAAISSLGIAFSVGIVVVGRFSYDSIEQLMEVQFHAAMREDVAVGFVRTRPVAAIDELAALPGVIRAEGIRVTLARARRGPIHRDVPVMALPPDATLRAVVDGRGRRVASPREGVLMTDFLAERLGLRPGDRVELEWLEGRRRTSTLPLTGVVDEPFGMQIYIAPDRLRAELREAASVSTAVLRVERAREAELLAALRDRPLVGAVTRKRALLERFHAQSGEQMRIFTIVLSLFAAVIAIGIVYNDARVLLSMRERDLASLRVLGFTRAEISQILLGELGARVLVGIPVGLLLGRMWAHWMMSTVDPETYRLTVVIAPTSYLFAAGVVVTASLVSALLVRRRLDRLDLVAVLKTRE